MKLAQSRINRPDIMKIKKMCLLSIIVTSRKLILPLKPPGRSHESLSPLNQEYIN